LADDIVVRVEGLEELQAALKKFPQEFDKGAKEALMPGLIRVQREATKLAPVDIGILQASIGAEAKGGILDVQKVGSQIVGRMGSRIEYAPYQEFGTSKMKAQPYLRPALEQTRDEVVKMFEKGIAKVLKRLKL